MNQAQKEKHIEDTKAIVLRIMSGELKSERITPHLDFLNANNIAIDKVDGEFVFIDKTYV